MDGSHAVHRSYGVSCSAIKTSPEMACTDTRTHGQTVRRRTDMPAHARTHIHAHTHIHTCTYAHTRERRRRRPVDQKGVGWHLLRCWHTAYHSGSADMGWAGMWACVSDMYRRDVYVKTEELRLCFCAARGETDSSASTV